MPIVRDLPETATGADGKRYPSRRPAGEVVNGDLVTDDHGDERSARARWPTTRRSGRPGGPHDRSRWSDRRRVVTASIDPDRAEALARRFHETYERLAPDYGYETRRDSAVPWEQVPERNRSLMIAVAAEILTEGGA